MNPKEKYEFIRGDLGAPVSRTALTFLKKRDPIRPISLLTDQRDQSGRKSFRNLERLLTLSSRDAL